MFFNNDKNNSHWDGKDSSGRKLPTNSYWAITVSYTHLDVYKRQIIYTLHLEVMPKILQELPQQTVKKLLLILLFILEQ